MIGFFNNKIVALIILGTIIAGTAAGVVLVRQQQILKSRAAYTDTGTTCDNGRKVGEFWPGVCDKSGKRIYMACNSDLTIGKAFMEEDSTCVASTQQPKCGTATCTSTQTCKFDPAVGSYCEDNKSRAETNCGTVNCTSTQTCKFDPAVGSYCEDNTITGGSTGNTGNVGVSSCQNMTCRYSESTNDCPSGLQWVTGRGCSGDNCQGCDYVGGCSQTSCIPPSTTTQPGGGSSGNGIPVGDNPPNAKRPCDNAYTWKVLAPGTNGAPAIDAKFGLRNGVAVNSCSAHSDCPQNSSDPQNVNASSSNWCYEFGVGNRCIQLQHIPGQTCAGGGGGTGGNGGISGCSGSTQVCTGSISCANLKSALTGANYPGSWDLNSAVKAYNEAACPGGTTSTTPLPPAQNLRATCTFEGENLVNPTFVNYTVNQTRGVGGARPTSLTQKYSLSGTVSGDGFLDVGEWTKDNVWVRAFRPGEEISISSPTNWLQVGYNVRFGNVTFSNTKFVEVLPADKPRVKATWNPIPESVAYVVRVNADPWDPWSPVDLGTYNGTLHIAPEIGSRDFGANTQGNTSTAYEAQVVQGLKYNLSIQGVRQGEAYPYKGQYAGVDFTCSPATPSVPPSVPPSTPPIATVAYRIAESPADLNSAAWQTYTAAGMTIDYDFQTPGDKFIFVQFKDSAGNVANSTNCPKCQNQIRVLGENPAIASCSLSFDKNKTFINLTGKNFGSVKGKAKSEETELEIKQWKNENVVLVWTDAPSGQSLPVTLTNTDGQVAEGSCSAISQLSVGAKVFCRQPSQHKTDNVDMVLVGAFEGGKKTSQKVSIDKDGVIQGLNQKLEAGKAYRISLKAPKSLRRTSKPFIAQEGTTTVPDFVLPVGDIFPADGGDGKINLLDRTALIRQWNISGDARGRSGDFNLDGRVNSFDWVCMRVSMPDAVSGDDPEPVPGIPSIGVGSSTP